MMSARLRWFALVLSSALLAVPLVATAALGQDDGDGDGAGDGGKVTFTVGQVEDLRTFNPLNIIEVPEYEVSTMQYDLLLNFDKETLEPTPGLATDWRVSKDGKTWTFDIRDTATWHDGEPVTAADIAFTFNFMLDKNITTFTDYLPYTDSITAPDDHTLVWKTTRPTGAPTYPPYIYILPEHVWSKLDQPKKFDNFPNPVGSGPFRVTEWRRGQFYRMEAYKEYWGGEPHIDEVVFRSFKNNEAMMQALRRGEIDFAIDVPAKLAEVLETADGVRMSKTAPVGFTQMSMNQLADGDTRPYCVDSKPDPDPCESTGHPALLDHDVRLAIAHAIDKQTLVDRIRLGNGMPGTTIVPPASPWHYDVPEDELIPFDLREANRILDNAGYDDTDGDGVREMPGGGRPLEFRFLANTEEPDTVPATQFIQGWLRQIGIETNVDGVTEGKLVDIWLANDYDMYIWGWVPVLDPDDMLSVNTTSQCLVWSDHCWSNKRFDKLYEQQRTTLDREKRQEIVDEMQLIYYKDVPESVLWYDQELQAYRADRWTGFVDQIGFLLNQWGTYSYLNVRPISEEQTPPAGGISAGVWIAVVVAIAVIAGAVVLVRRRGEEDRA
jgi:peptide/nickel transport system substrate-binding protein